DVCSSDLFRRTTFCAATTLPTKYRRTVTHLPLYLLHYSHLCDRNKPTPAIRIDLEHLPLVVSKKIFYLSLWLKLVIHAFYIFAHPLTKTSTKCIVLIGRLCLSIYPCRCNKHEESVEMIKSASISSAWCTFCSAMALDIASNLTANVPPNPQQVSVCRISTKSNPATFANSCLGSSLIWHSRNPEHESW